MFSSKLKRMLVTCSRYREICGARNLSVFSRRFHTRRTNCILTQKTKAVTVKTPTSLRQQIHLASALLSENKDDQETTQNVAEDVPPETTESTEESESAPVQAQEERHIAYLSGIPWSSTFDEVKEFLSGCNLKNGEDSFYPLAISDGRFSGNAYVEFDTSEDLEKALQKDMHYMRHRFIRVDATPAERMERRLATTQTTTLQTGPVSSSNVVRLRGLPFACTVEDVKTFFEGLEVAEDGIVMETLPNGRCAGTAYVKLASREEFTKAMERDRQYIQNRYIELFPSSEVRFSKAKEQNTSRQDSLKTSRKIKMLGLPWSANQQDIADFFLPLKLDKIEIVEDKFGRSSGIAYVLFASPEDAEEAMKKNQDYIFDRFINLKRIPDRGFDAGPLEFPRSRFDQSVA